MTSTIVAANSGPCIYVRPQRKLSPQMADALTQLGTTTANLELSPCILQLPQDITNSGKRDLDNWIPNSLPGLTCRHCWISASHFFTQVSFC